jgi:hypothetical protein
MRAIEIRLLPGETQDQYDEMVAGWKKQWKPADYQEHKLVDTLITNDWLHRRAERWLMETEASIVGQGGPDPMGWTAEQHRRLQFAQQHKANAERAFYRAWSTLQGFRKDFLREKEKERETLRKLEKQKEELQKELASRPPKPEPPPKPERRADFCGCQGCVIVENFRVSEWERRYGEWQRNYG